jgi:predicted dehydrogenase
MPGLTPKPNTARLAVIGMGNRAAHMSRLICEADPEFRVVAVADPQPRDALLPHMQRWRVPDAEHVDVFADVEQLLARADDFDGLIIGTPCDLHMPIAVQTAATRLPLFLEKPVAISWDQVEALQHAYLGREDQVVVSFPLRLTVHVQTAIEIIRSGRLGVINQVQAVNNVSYGGVYFGQWYRSYEKTGGLWLQKATHDFDYITQLLSSRPLTVTAMHSRLSYGGEMPPQLRCSACYLTDTCPESPQNLTQRGDDGGTLGGGVIPTPDMDHACTFSSNIYHQDAGSAIIMYENGAHASYAQNFISRRSAGLRGATVIGYDATLSFNWQADSVRVIDHHRERVDEIKVAASGFHGGGDYRLAANFVDVVRGRDRSRSPLNEGLLSAAMCLCARDAASTGMAQRVPVFQRVPGVALSPDAAPRRKGIAPIEPTDGQESPTVHTPRAVSS